MNASLGPLFALFPDAILVADADTHVVDANPAALALLGYTREELLQRSMRDIIASGSISAAAEFERFLREGQWQGDVDVRTRDGVLVPVEASAFLLSTPDGALSVSFLRDRSEHRRSEARLQSLLANAPDAVVVLDVDGRVSFASPAVERDFGYGPHDFVGSPRFDLVHPEDEPEARRTFAEIAALPGARTTSTVRVRHADGSWRWMEVTGQNRLADPAVRGIVVNFRDVTARVAAEEALTRERDLLRTVMDHLPDAVYIKDTSSRFLRLNPATAQILGIADPTEALGKTDFDFFPEALARQYYSDEQQVVATGQPLLNRLEAQSEDAATAGWWLTSTVPVRDASGAVVGIVGSGRNITERVRTEAALRESEARHRALLAALPDLVFRLDHEGTILDYKANRLDDLAAPPDVFLGRTVGETLPADVAAAIVAGIGRVLDSDGIETIEYALDMAEGRRHYEARMVAAGSAEVVAVVRNVTERQRGEEELRAALAAAYAANQATRQFLTMMSHELRTPIQAIMGYAELLLAGPGDSLTPDQAADVQTIQRGASRLVALVKQMLDLSRLEAGQVELTVEPVDLTRVLEEVRQDVAPQAVAAGVALGIELPTELPPVLADEMGVRQILLNLVGNALKFTEAGEVSVSADVADGEVAVTVRDTGIGIPPDVLDYIFEEFRQADSGMTRRHDGVGLGLNIARKLAEQQGGRISATSQPGFGSVFTLHLPAATPRGPGTTAPDGG
jgi:two-component system, sensor histidine kinase and response regulator